MVNLCKHGHVKMEKVHRLVSKAFEIKDEEKGQVNHKDGDKQNNRIGNLEWVTASENIRHAFEVGLKNAPSMRRYGEKNSHCKLTDTEVGLIRHMRNSGKTYEELSVIFGVGKSQIGRIVRNEQRNEGSCVYNEEGKYF